MSSAPSSAERAQDVPAGLAGALRTIAQDFAAFPTARTPTWIGAGAGLAAIGSTSDRALRGNLDKTRYQLFGAGASTGGGAAHAGLLPG